jgi:hypothetical protein
MNLRSPFWGLKANKAGDAFATEKSQTLALDGYPGGHFEAL